MLPMQHEEDSWKLLQAGGLSPRMQPKRGPLGLAGGEVHGAQHSQASPVPHCWEPAMETGCENHPPARAAHKEPRDTCLPPTPRGCHQLMPAAPARAAIVSLLKLPHKFANPP